MIKLPTASRHKNHLVVFLLFSLFCYIEVSAQVTIGTIDTKNGSSATSHSMTSVPAGALLVLTTSAASAQQNCSVSSSPSLTWTKRIDASAGSSGDAEIYTALFASGGSITVTSNWGSQQQASVCYVVTGQEGTLAGATASGTSQQFPSVNITSTRENSILFCVTADWNAVDGASRVFRNSPVDRYYHRSANNFTSYHYTKAMPTAGATTMGLTAPDMRVSNVNGGGTSVLEIRSPADAVAPSQPTNLAAPSFAATQISLTWTASSDNVGVTGYEIYLNNTLNTTTSNVTSYTLTGLTPSTTYEIYIKAKDAAGNVSTQSSSVSKTTLSSDYWSVLGNGGTTPPDHFLGTTDSKRLVFRTNNTEWVTIDPAGNVGVGTSTPAARIDALMGSTTQSALRLKSIANQTANTFELLDESGNAIVKMRPPDGSTVYQATVTIDAGNKLNQPALALNNLGGGYSGVRMEYSGGGGMMLWDFDHTPTWTYVNKHAKWSVVNNAFDNSPESYHFSHSDQNANQVLMTLQGQPGQTGDMLKIRSGIGANVFRVTSTGDAVVRDIDIERGMTAGKGKSTLAPLNNYNTVLGHYSLASNTSGNMNTAVGDLSMASNTTGTGNTAIGANSLMVNTIGSNNAALGYRALENNTTGSQNTAIGNNSMPTNTIGSGNTAVGRNALALNNTADLNTAVGDLALTATSSGGGNTAVGGWTQVTNTTGVGNTSMGGASLYFNSTGNYNTAFGHSSLYMNTNSYNTAYGSSSLYNTTGTNNTAIGYNAGYSLTTGSNNIFIGAGAQYNISATASNQLNIGNWIYGNDGNIGIGVTNPATKFHTNGTLRFENLTEASSNTRILSTDNSGNVAWRDASTLGSGAAWSLTGNNGTNPSTQFIGTTDAQALAFRSNNVERIKLNTDGSINFSSDGQTSATFSNTETYGNWVNINNTSSYNAAGSGLRLSLGNTVKTQIFHNDNAFSLGGSFDVLSGNAEMLSRFGDVYLSTGTFRSNGLIVKQTTGNVGIGTTAPNSNAKLDVNGNIFSSGKVLIGTTDLASVGTYSLAVNGDAIFNKVKVKLYSTGWPDHVFHSNYQLRSLKDLESFIQKNHHLPDVPSAAEVEKNGLDVGDNQATLLKKIEELTLYLIELNKKIEKLSDENETLKKKLSTRN